MKTKLTMFAMVLVAIVGVVIASARPQQITSGSTPMTMIQAGNVAVVTVAGAQKVDGSGVTQPVSIASMPSTPVTRPLTDAQLRASAVPVSGSFSSTPLTGCGATNYDSGIITIPTRQLFSPQPRPA